MKILHYLIILAISTYVVILYGTGQITLYISYRYELFCYVFALIAAFFSIVGLIRAIEEKRWIGWRDGLDTGKVVGLGIMFLIVGLAFGLPPQSLSVAAASQQENNFNTINFDRASAADLFLSDTRSLTLGDWVKSLAFDPNPQNYEEKEVKISGFAFFGEAAPENSFKLSRFVLTCCVVDARPVGLFVELPEDTEIVEGEWYEIQGRFEQREDQLVIVPTEATLIDEPDEPYVF